jgi:hypothetical protein
MHEQSKPGGTQPVDALLPLLYDELRKLAAAKMAREPAGQTLQATGWCTKPGCASAATTNVSHTLRGEARSRLAGTFLKHGVDNAFDRDPPLYYSASGYIAGFARRPAGRFFYTELKKTY